MSNPTLTRVGRGGYRGISDRLGGDGFIRRTLNKVFPDHWSFMLGEIALYSFIILLLTGTFMAFFFDPSDKVVVYQGSYVPLRGVEMSQAYSSVIHMSFDVRAGLLIRQIHHWAALLFVAGISVHLMRVFFTGAFRKPREINWIIGVLLLITGIAEGFAGYSLPDDLLSGTGLRIAYSIAESIPLVGEYVAFFAWGGEFPGHGFFSRLYIAHVFVIPMIITGLITVHMMILWHQKHTQFPGRGKTEDNVVGSRFWPHYTAKGGGFFFLVFAVLSFLGAFVQINPVWLYGPYTPYQVSALAQPDWYVGFLEGALRLMPGIETRGLGIDIPWSVFLPAVLLPGLLFTLLAVYPFIEEWLTGDHDYHHLLDSPRDRPVRTAFGASALAFYLVLMAAGGNDVLAKTFHVSLNATTWVLRVLVIVLPPITFWATRRICLGLQIRSEELVHHGVETGTIVRMPSGEVVEITRPVSGHVAPHVLVRMEAAHAELEAHGDGHRRAAQPPGRVAALGRAVAGFFVERRPPKGEPKRPTTLTRR